MINAFVALGSNLGNPAQQLTDARNELAAIRQTTLLKTSGFYKNPAIGMQNQPDFINAVVKLQTALTAKELLQTLLAIENKHHRIRAEKNGPRTLDLDLLLYGNEVINTEDLHVPHPRMKERSFVIVPLIEIEPLLRLPCGTSVEFLMQQLSDAELQLEEL